MFRYLAPEYTENGIVSVRTDVYSFGIVLIQLISGRKAVDSKREGQQSSLRQWVCCLAIFLASHFRKIGIFSPLSSASHDQQNIFNSLKLCSMLFSKGIIVFQALSLIGELALHKLVDPRLGESYNTYELYNMAKAAYLCVQTEPENRPSMAEVTFCALCCSCTHWKLS